MKTNTQDGRPCGFNGSVNIQKAVTFDHNFAIEHNFLAFFIKYFFADKYILNEKSKTNKTVNLKIEFDYRPKRIRFQIEETECF